MTDNGESRIMESVDLKRTLHEVEEAKRDLKYEVGTLLSREGVILKEYSGSAHSVVSPESDADMFMNGIFTHNHPGGRCFTLDDIKNFIELGLYEVRASTPQGTYFSLRAGDGDLNRAIAIVMEAEKVGERLSAAAKLREQIIDMGIETEPEEFSDRVFGMMGEDVDQWLDANAREFGYVYAKGEL